jgi:uncharacterized protein YebE (UPF0316 family)
MSDAVTWLAPVNFIHELITFAWGLSIGLLIGVRINGR